MSYLVVGLPELLAREAMVLRGHLEEARGRRPIGKLLFDDRCCLADLQRIRQSGQGRVLRDLIAMVSRRHLVVGLAETDELALEIVQGCPDV